MLASSPANNHKSAYHVESDPSPAVDSGTRCCRRWGHRKPLSELLVLPLCRAMRVMPLGLQRASEAVQPMPKGGFPGSVTVSRHEGLPAQSNPRCSFLHSRAEDLCHRASWLPAAVWRWGTVTNWASWHCLLGQFGGGNPGQRLLTPQDLFQLMIRPYDPRSRHAPRIEARYEGHFELERCSG